MIRKNDINVAAKVYASTIDSYRTLNTNCIYYELDNTDLEKAFIAGAEWYRDHLFARLWHSADKEPKGDYWNILCQDEEGNSWSISKWNLYDIYEDWKQAVECDKIDKWAYIEDFNIIWNNEG